MYTHHIFALIIFLKRRFTGDFFYLVLNWPQMVESEQKKKKEKKNDNSLDVKFNFINKIN